MVCSEPGICAGRLQSMTPLKLPIVAISSPMAAARRQAAADTMAALLARLALAPRVPVALLAEASVAFADGLVLGRLVTSGDARVTFDVFWLAMLGLAE